jgi:hypothetical protein
MIKNNSRAFVNQLLLVMLVTVGLGGSVGVGLVWLRHQNSVVANNIRALEAKQREVERLLSATKSMVESSQSFEELRRLNSEFKLGLAPMTDAQFAHLRGDPVQRLMAKANRELFENGQVAITPLVTLTP